MEVPGLFHYAKDIGERLYYNIENNTTNLSKTHHVVQVRNARPLVGKASLDREGFAAVEHKSAVKDWDSEAEITGIYYREAVELAKKVAGAKDAFVFDHTVRKPGTPRGPVESVHLDYTIPSAGKRLRDFFGPDAEKCGRWAIVNIWRPIKVPQVFDFPLAVLDARSVPFEDLLPYDLIYPDRVGGNYTIRYNPQHAWYYLPRQTPEEVLLFKQFDSEPAQVRFAPHSAFKDPNAPPEGGFAPRESIELRLFVFFDGPAPKPIEAKL
ncbi:methyltransferase [Hyaloraphidium curvatum]|nr:methyltransferase [Hyaloraphidium curvatum]